MTTIPPFSPGCFGSALSFRKEDMVCRACMFSAQCEPVHIDSKNMLRERFGIIVKEPRRKKEVEIDLNQTADPARLSLPKKVFELMERVDRGGFDILAKLSRGENPFDGRLPFLAVACHLLLKMKEPVTRDLLTAALVHQFKWKENTAESHSRMSIQLLEHVGAVECSNGMMKLKAARPLT